LQHIKSAEALNRKGEDTVKGRYVLISLMLMVLLTPIVLWGQIDPGKRDTIRVGVGTINLTRPLPESLIIPVYAFSDDTISTFTIPIGWKSSRITLSDVIFDPVNVVSPTKYLSWESFPDDNRAYLLGIDLHPGLRPWGAWSPARHIADLIFKIDQNMPDTLITIDSTFIPTSFQLALQVWPSNSSFIPRFVAQSLSLIGPPAIDHVRPKEASPGDTMLVEITGRSTHFQQSSSSLGQAKLVHGASQITATSAWVVSAILIQAYFIIPTDAVLGLWDVVAGDGYNPVLTLTEGFRIHTDPRLVSISPVKATQGENLWISFTGRFTNFDQSGLTAFLCNVSDTIFADPIAVASSTQLNAFFSIPKGSPVGLWTAGVRQNGYPDIVLNGAFTLAGSPPEISISVSSLSDSLLSSETAIHSLSVFNLGGDTLHFRARVTYDHDYELRKLAEQCVTGIALTEQKSANGESLLTLSPADVEKFKASLERYQSTVDNSSEYRNFKRIAVVGDNNYDMIYRLMSDSTLVERYLFFLVNDYNDYSAIQSYDALVVAESYASSITQNEAEAIRRFYDYSKPILMGVHYLQEGNQNIKSALYPVFGISGASYCYSYYVYPNIGNPITDGVVPFNYSNFTSSFILSEADWILRDDNGAYPAVSFKGKARTALFGTYLPDLTYSNPLLIANAVNWMIYGKGWLKVPSDLTEVLPGASKTVDVTLDAEGLFTGDYSADINFDSDDPIHSVVTIPVSLHVVGVPELLVTADSISFGTVFVGGTSEDTAFIYNNGTGVLIITKISSDNTDFQTGITSATVLPRDSVALSLSFSPHASGMAISSLTITSNDLDHPMLVVRLTGSGQLPPHISVAPASLRDTLHTGETSSAVLTISNLGVADLIWKAVIEEVDATMVVSQSPSFSSPNPQLPDKTVPDGFKQPDPGLLYMSPPLLARQASSEQLPNDKSLEKILLNLNQHYQSVTSIIPNRYDFSDGVTGYYIYDGGNDMYNGGNYLWTNLGGNNIPYSDNSISLMSSALGTGGRYFTRKFPGLFVFVADVSGIQSFAIGGSLGASGNGNTDGAVLQTHIAGLEFLGFVKRVYNAGDPSVNHLIIVEYDPSVSHTFSTYTGEDFHQLSNLGGVTRIYDLLYARQSGGYIDNSTTLSIMNAFLRAVGIGPEWVELGLDSGVVAAGAQSDIPVHFTAAGLAGADYSANLAISSNDPSNLQLNVPLTLTVIGAPDIRLSTGLLAFDTAFVGGSLSHTLVVYNDGTTDLTITGITSSSSEFATDRDSLTVAPGDSQVVRCIFAPQAVGVKVETMTLASNDFDQPQLQVSLSGIAVMPPNISVVPDSLTDTLRTGESSKQVMTVTNSGAYRLDFSVDIQYHQELQALVSQCIKGISLTEITTADGGAVASLSPKDSVEFDSRLSDFYESVGRMKGLQDLPVVAVVGDQADDIIFRLMSDSVLAKDYLFYRVYNYSSYSLLKSYDGLIVAEYYYYWNIEKAAVIRSFYDAHKPVLLAADDFNNYPDSVKQLLNPVFGISSVSRSGFTWGSLNAANPITKGVTTVAMPYYYDYYCWFTLAKGDWIFSDQAGRQYGVSNDQTARSVLFGADFSPFWDAGNKQLMRNAINWMMRFGWIALSSWNGSLAPGSSVDIDVTLQARQMPEGDHQADVIFSSNDPANSLLTIPARLHVIGIPDIASSDSLIDFGTIFVASTTAESLLVRNRGTAVLSVTNLSATSPSLEISATSFTLAPGDSQLVVLRFTPTSSGILRDTLVIVSNDPDNPSLRIPLLAKAVTPPDISWTPASLSDSLTTADSLVKALIISNSGGSDLKYHIQFQYPMAGSSSSVHVEAGQLGANAELRELGAVAEDGEAQSASQSPEPASSSLASGEIVKIAVVGGYSTDVYYRLSSDSYLTARYSFTDLGNDVSYTSLNGYQGLVVSEYGSGLTPSEATVIAKFFSSHRPVLVGMYNLYNVSNDVKTTLFPLLGIESANYGYYTWGSLNPHHPISSGVDQVIESYDSGSWFTPAGARWIFTGQDSHFYGVSSEGSARSVTIGAYLYGFLYYSNNRKLMANAIDWMMGNLGWMSAQPDTGTIAPGHNRSINLTLRGVMATPGNHTAIVNVLSNDPDHPLVTVPVYLNVTGIPEIACSETLIEFPPTFVGGRAYDTVVVANNGTTTLHVAAIVTDSSKFSVDRPLFTVEPQAQYGLRVAFTPKEIGSTSGLLELHSDDPNHSMITVHLGGVGKLPPDIEVYPSDLNVTLDVDDTTTRIISIVNQGTSDLMYQVSVSSFLQSQLALTHSAEDSAVMPADKPLTSSGVATGNALGVLDAMIFHDDFEGNANGWTHQSSSGCDLWHVTTRDYYSATHSWWCGIEQQGNYECAPFVDATLISPAISLVGWSGRIYLTFEEAYNTEYNYDNCMVDVSTNGGVSWIPLRGRYGNSVYGNSYGWRTSSMDLSSLAGTTINIRFRFDTGDEYNNNYLGWFVDDVSIVASSFTPISLTPTQGTVSPNDTSYVMTEFNATLLPPGNYDAHIMVSSNDPDESYVDIPVHLQIKMPFVCGDADGDGQVSVADVVFLVSYMFQQGNPPEPPALGDLDCSGSINIADIVYLINYIFREGPAPCSGC
jgi:hypothetical protein